MQPYSHQIRAHLAFLGQPVLGDIKYGNRKMNERTGIKTQAPCGSPFWIFPPKTFCTIFPAVSSS
jgi:hypothetical protein